MVKWMVLSVIAGLVVIELVLMLTLGAWLGVAKTVSWVFISCVLGLLILRYSGLRTLIRIHHKLREEVLPTMEMIDMGIIILGALFMIAPGFFTDILGMTLLIPPVRWVLKGIICNTIGEYLPSPFPPVRGYSPVDEVIEIQPED